MLRPVKFIIRLIGRRLWSRSLRLLEVVISGIWEVFGRSRLGWMRWIVSVVELEGTWTSFWDRVGRCLEVGRLRDEGHCLTDDLFVVVFDLLGYDFEPVENLRRNFGLTEILVQLENVFVAEHTQNVLESEKSHHFGVVAFALTQVHEEVRIDWD